MDSILHNCALGVRAGAWLGGQAKEDGQLKDASWVGVGCANMAGFFQVLKPINSILNGNGYQPIILSFNASVVVTVVPFAAAYLIRQIENETVREALIHIEAQFGYVCRVAGLVTFALLTVKTYSIYGAVSLLFFCVQLKKECLPEAVQNGLSPLKSACVFYSGSPKRKMREVWKYAFPYALPYLPSQVSCLLVTIK